MTRIDEIYGEDIRYLTADKIGLGKEKVFVVDGADIVEFQGKNKIRLKICEKVKGGTGQCFYFTLNKSNARKFKEAGIEDMEDMINREITITSMLVSFKGKEVPGLRITKVKY